MLDNSTELVVKGHIATLTINRPAQLNSLNSEVIKEIDEQIEKISNMNDLRVLIITGAGKSFVAGADISEMSNLDYDGGIEFGKSGASLFRKIENLEIPVIAAVNGFALGGGCELALACDIRLASENAKFGQPEVGLGITPGFSGTQRLPRVIGLGKAKEMIYTGKIITAREALELGLVNYVFPVEELLEKAFEMAQKISLNAPIAVKYSKKAINEGHDLTIDEGINLEIKLFASCFQTQDQKMGMNAFLNKTKPEFKNR